MKVELLYFDGCPSYEELLPELRGLLTKEGVETEIELRRVETIEAAERDDFGLKCRLYRDKEGVSRTPPERWIREAIEGSR